MTRALFAFLAAALLLAGCGTTQKQEEGAKVEERGGAAGTGAEGPQSYGVDQGRQSVMEQLNDPTSPLSQRIIYFDYDSSEIRQEYRATVEAHAAFLAANPTLTVSLEGHADERGSREYNLALGERRAQSVKRQMVLLGANGSQIRTTSYGEERPVVQGHDEGSWSQNRRVEIIY
jgi:peptidoglycan-associated lipoprotein